MGLNPGAGAIPVPDSEAGGIATLALLFTVSVPVRAPPAVGWNVTLIVQEVPTSNELPQLLVCAKSPVTWIEEILTVVFAIFTSTVDCEPLVVPTS